MVLSSQTPRAGMSRMYMSSRSKSRVRWGWVIAIGIALVSMYLFVWSGDEQGQPDARPGGAVADSADGQAAHSPSPTPPPAGPRSVSELPPPADLPSDSRPSPNTRTTRPVVRTITPGESGATINNNPPSGVIAHASNQPRAASGSAPPSLTTGMTLVREGRLVQGRSELSRLLLKNDGSLSDLDAQTVRETLTSINKHLVFSNEVVPGDPLAESYMVQRGDYLSRIAPKYNVPYRFIERINNTPAERLQAGKPIKVIKGPFHARISKRDYRMDLFLIDDDGQEIYVRSFTVGLGKDDSTPLGKFIVDNTKVKNPSWKNPRTGEFFAKNDPKNPIGEYWIGLDGADANTQSLDGYGIHGTIDPSSIGRQASMGCIRLSDDDVALVFDMLEPNKSTVEITW